MDVDDVLVGFIAALVVVAIVAVFPILVVWALQTILGLPFRIDPWTWLAGFVLILLFGTRIFSGRLK